MSSPLTPLYELREKVLVLYGKYGAGIGFVFRLLLVFLMETAIIQKTGYAGFVNPLPVRFIIALICAVMPYGFVNFVMGMLLIYEMLSVSMILGAVTAIMLLSMFLINLIFLPSHRFMVFVVPVLFMIRLPYLLPLMLGIMAPISAVIPLSFGLVVYFLLQYVNGYAGVLSENVQMTEVTALLKQILTGIQGGRMLFVFIGAFLVTTVFVYAISRLSTDHSHLIALAAGSGLLLVLLLFGMGAVATDTLGFTVPAVIIGCISSAFAALFLEFFRFSVDYKHVEYTQFEDDEYFYYVKAVPKIHVSEKTNNDRKPIEDEETQVQLPADSEGAAE